MRFQGAPIKLRFLSLVKPGYRQLEAREGNPDALLSDRLEVPAKREEMPVTIPQGTWANPLDSGFSSPTVSLNRSVRHPNREPREFKANLPAEPFYFHPATLVLQRLHDNRFVIHILQDSRSITILRFKQDRCQLLRFA